MGIKMFRIGILIKEKALHKKIRLGISACLLGEKVCKDGGHQIERFLVDTLGQYIEYVPNMDIYFEKVARNLRERGRTEASLSNFTPRINF